MSNVVHLFAEKADREYYALRQGRAVACVYMRNGLLSHVVVTDAQAEGINNRAYRTILNGHAEELTEAQYRDRRNMMRHHAPLFPAMG